MPEGPSLTAWTSSHLASHLRIGGQEINLLQSAILFEYSFVALALYKGWIISGFLVLLYLCSTRDWRGRILALLVLTSVTMLFLIAVVWNGVQILFIRDCNPEISSLRRIKIHRGFPY